MRLTAIILLAGCLQVSAKVNSQTITFSARNADLQSVFAVIKKQTGFTVAVKKAYLQRTEPVNIDAVNMPLEEFLSAVFKDQPLSYNIEAQTIFLNKKLTLPKITEKLETTQPPVMGIVHGPNGQPLAGVNIVVKGTKRGTVSAADGSFSIEAKDGDVLLVSSIGYSDRQVTVHSNTIGVIPLALSDNKLDEVQIVAYGTTTKRFNTGNITSVKGDEITKQPVSNPLLALQGRVPGLIITQGRGVAGSGVQVLIQGQNSIEHGNDPFYVIDGVPYTSQNLQNLGSILGNSNSAGFSESSFGNPLSFINPANIESIEVLKDADATAIYGSRAANGAILITTKKGKAGRTGLDINLKTGWSSVANKLKRLNNQQYITMRKEAKENDGRPILATDYDLNGFWDSTRNTDWQEVLIGKTARYHDAQLSLSGGTDQTRFLLAAGYHQENSVFIGDFADKKSSLMFNLNNTSPDKKFYLNMSGSILFDYNRLPNIDLTEAAMTLPPVAPELFNEDGSLNWAQNASGVPSWSNARNPVSYTKEVYKLKTHNLLANAVLGYKPINGLDIRTSFGYNYLGMDENLLFTMESVRPDWREIYGNSLRYANYGRNKTSSWIIEPQASYTKQVYRGKIDILVGASIQQRKDYREQLTGGTFNSDDVMEDIKSAANVNVDYTLSKLYKYYGVFTRANYNLENKYIINLTARRDGSSRFGSVNRFHNFGAVGFAWIFSEESFVKNNLNFLSFGKLRGSYGTTGSDQIGDYQYLDLYDPLTSDIPYQEATGLEPSRLANPYLEWEETRKLQAGLDLGFLRDRILINATYFMNRSFNQLLGNGLPSFAGFFSITSNLPAKIQNTGWELSVSTANVKKRDFTWNTNFNITIPKNKLLSFDNFENSFYRDIYFIGKPLAFTRAYRLHGVNSETGFYEYFTKNGEITNDPSFEDAAVIVFTAPKYYGGFNNTFTFKAFQLDFLFQFTSRKVKNPDLFPSRPGFSPINQSASVWDRWQKPGDIASIQRFTSVSAYAAYTSDAASSTAAWMDGTFIRMKNISLAWQLPKAWKQQLRLATASVFVQGQNLFTITGYTGLDPESLNNRALPPLRVIATGIQLTF